MRLHLIKSGFFSCEGGAMFGVVPRKTWERRYPSVDDLCPLAMNLVLLDFGARKILLDTGVGLKNLRKLRSYGFRELLDVAESVISCGIDPDEITDVVLSHLHFDHCGGSTYLDDKGFLQITFPKATHWVSKKQFSHFLSPTLLDRDSFLSENVELIHKSGLLRLVEADCDLFDGFRLMIFEGHTPGQIVSRFQLDGETYVFVSDVVPTMAHFSPLWISPYDLYPVDSVSEKVRLLEEAADKNWIVVSFHDVCHPFARVKKIGNSFKPIFLFES